MAFLGSGENGSVDWLNVDGTSVDRDRVEDQVSDGDTIADRPESRHLAQGVDDRPGAAPVPARRRQRAKWWKELLVIAWLYWLYDAVNNLTAVRETLAKAHGASIMHLEQRLHLDPELWLNRWLSHHNWLGAALSDFYNVVHLDLTFVVICWLWWKAPTNYRVLRNTLVLTNVVGFLVFMVYPVAPPRMLTNFGFVDTIVDTHAWFSSHSQGALAKAANQFAAMPSLHVAWAVWVALAVWSLTRVRAVRLVALLHPIITVLAILATANHYLLDAVAGLLTFAVCLVVASGWNAYRRHDTALEPIAGLAEPSGSSAGDEGEGDGDRLHAIA
jgi:PAP2 superfamily